MSLRRSLYWYSEHPLRGCHHRSTYSTPRASDATVGFSAAVRTAVKGQGADVLSPLLALPGRGRSSDTFSTRRTTMRLCTRRLRRGESPPRDQYRVFKGRCPSVKRHQLFLRPTGAPQLPRVPHQLFIGVTRGPRLSIAFAGEGRDPRAVGAGHAAGFRPALPARSRSTVLPKPSSSGAL
jgi:hypothetical protein